MLKAMGSNKPKKKILEGVIGSPEKF